MLTEKKQKYLAKQAIKAAILEDLGDGDITTALTIPDKVKGQATLIVKESCILAGEKVCEMICKEIDRKLIITFSKHDGDFVKANTNIALLTGDVSSILKAERLLLNFLQRMSAIATKTNIYVKKIKHTGATLLDTRKTTPNFRVFEKWAVSIGGGSNHRFGLFDEVLVKDNHIQANSNIEKLLDVLAKRINKQNKNYPIVVEVKNLSEFKIALRYTFVNRILLDNMPLQLIRKIVILNNSQKKLEVSGGVNSKNILNYAKSGVDYISVGELTHHIASIDMALNLH